ncbi:MAG: hypothetical protein HW421_33 [Ignavibacteria bacterium]|nr:hypothetical protein [Ignavibacteria bacterium]
MKTKLSFLAILLIAFCINIQAKSFIKYGEIQNGKPVLTITPGNLIIMLEKMLNNGSRITSVEIEVNGSNFFLKGTGNHLGKSVTCGFLLVKVGNEFGQYLNAVETLQICVCANCASCLFNFNDSNQFEGCKCTASEQNSEGGFNHCIRQVVITD